MVFSADDRRKPSTWRPNHYWATDMNTLDPFRLVSIGVAVVTLWLTHRQMFKRANYFLTLFFWAKLSVGSVVEQDSHQQHKPWHLSSHFPVDFISIRSERGRVIRPLAADLYPLKEPGVNGPLCSFTGLPPARWQPFKDADRKRPVDLPSDFDVESRSRRYAAFAQTASTLEFLLSLNRKRLNK